MALWKSRAKQFSKLTAENRAIRIPKRFLSNFSSDREEIFALAKNIVKQLLFKEPILYRRLAHNLIEADKLKERTDFYTKYLRPVPAKYLWDCLTDQILEGSEVAGEVNCTGLPVYLFSFNRAGA